MESGSDTNAEIDALVRQLYEVEERLRVLTGGEVDAVAHPKGNFYLLQSAQQRLRQNEVQLRTFGENQRAILNALPARIALVDSEGIIRSVNQAWLDFWRERGVEEDFIGSNYLKRGAELYDGPSEDRRAMTDGFQSVLSGARASFSHVYPFHSPTARRWFQLLVSPLQGEEQGGVVVAHFEVTEQKLAEESLQKSDARYRRVFNQQFQFMAILSAEGTILEINDLPLRRSALRREDVIGRPFWETAWAEGVEEAAQWWLDAMARAVHQDEPVFGEVQYCMAPGDVRDGDAALTAVRDANGAPEYFIAQFVDTTDRKRAEDALRAREALLRIAGRYARLGGWSIDLAEGRLTWSEEVCSIHDVPVGFAPTIEEAIAFYLPEYRDRVRQTVEDCINYGKGFEIEAEMTTAKGRHIWVQSVGNVERDASGKIVRVTGAVQDISERKRAEAESRAREEAEQASRAKSAFLATMSHEIRTPMNGVIGMLDVLYQTSLERHQIDMIDLILDSALSLLKIIDDVLDLSKIEAGKLEVESLPMSVADTVEKVCDLAGHVAQRQGVSLSFFTAPGLPALMLGDEGRLRQILLNLVNNAIKFSTGLATPGRVSVRAVRGETPSGPTVELRVADNGIGMDKGTVARLFAPFTQADASTTRRYGGSGLGLAISRHLTDLMGGTVTVQSQPGKGSTFVVSLPLVAHTSPEQAPRNDLLVEGLRCLVIGTPDQIAEDLAAYLEHGGALVRSAADLAAAAALSEKLEAGLWVWVVPCTSFSFRPEELRRYAPARSDLQIRYVILGSSRLQRTLQATTSEFVTVERRCPSQRMLLTAVAIAAGRADMEAAMAPMPSDPARWANPYGKRTVRRSSKLVLIAEDNEANQRVILRQLDLLGFAAHVAGNGTEALDLWRRGGYSLVITDLQMPEQDGFDLARRIRAEEHGQARIPIIALTANAMKEEEEACLAAGMDAYLTKPARLITLKDALQKWLPLDAQPLLEGEPARFWKEEPEPTEDAAKGSARAPVDVRVLAAQVGDDPEVTAELIEYFLVGAARAAEEMREAIASNSPNLTEMIAHRLKSSARSVGAHKLGEICAAIEQAGTACELGDLVRLYPRFEAEMVLVTGFLETWCKQQAKEGPLES